MTMTVDLILSLTVWSAAGLAVRCMLSLRSWSVTAVTTWLDSRQASRIVSLAALLALILSVGLGVAQYRLTVCQARYAEVSNTSQRARAEAAELDRQAMDKMLDAVVDDPRTSLEAIRLYRATRADADRQRAANPVPPAPSTNCG